MSRAALRADFFEGARGRRLVVARRPDRASRGTVLVVPPFAEEMNKARRMVAEVSEQLAASGVASVIVDLFGTGDSDGEFADATWSDWLDDLAAADAWSTRNELPVTAILAIRLGCPLAAAYLQRRGRSIDRWVFWQPVLDGARYLDQFLRLRVAAGMFDEGPKVTVADLRRQVQEQGVLEVAGYDITQRLLADLDAVKLRDAMGSSIPPLHWVELARSTTTPVPVPVTRLVDELVRGGANVRLESVVSEPIWTATEIVVSPALAQSTVAAFTGAPQPVQTT
ncbi:MAG TPA: hydrolase 2, exosortase A system-associated [Povalibacter sp.]|nr:hydrolase 2, exosortase A system-associated [Povalibacter sp.]